MPGGDAPLPFHKRRPQICLLTNARFAGFLHDRGHSPRAGAAAFHPHLPMNIASFLNFAGPDVIVIAFIVTLIFGAKKLPDLARGMGQAVREFTKAKEEPLVKDKDEVS